MRTHDVLIVGGGPVGVMLAAALADRGLDAVVWEARVEDPARSRALGVHPPSIDLFDRLGLADDLLARAVRIRRGIATSGPRTIGAVPFDRASGRWPFVAAVLFAALVVSVVAHTSYYALIRRYEANLLAPLTLMTPLATIAFGVALTGDHLDRRMIAGAALALLGVLVVAMRARPKTALLAEREQA